MIKYEKKEVTTMEDLNLTAADEREYVEYQDGLAKSIESEILSSNTSQADIEEAIAQYVNENADQNIVTDRIVEATGISDDIELLKCDEAIDKDIINEYTNIYSVDDHTDIIITPISIYVDELDIEYEGTLAESTSDTIISSFKNFLIEPCYAASTWKTVKVATKRTLYTNIGKAAASVHTGGKMKYNGTKATYHSGFYGHFHLYYTTYRNLTFDKVREASGNSYQFYAYGTFYKEASGISNKSKKISCKVKCSPSGKITKSYYPAL